MKIAMNLKAKALLATAVVSIGLFVNASPIWAEPQPLTIPSDGIVLQGQAKEKYVADYMKKFFSQMKPPAPFEAPAGWKMETVTVNGEDGNRYGKRHYPGTDDRRPEKERPGVAADARWRLCRRHEQ